MNLWRFALRQIPNARLSRTLGSRSTAPCSKTLCECRPTPPPSSTRTLSMGRPCLRSAAERAYSASWPPRQDNPFNSHFKGIWLSHRFSLLWKWSRLLQYVGPFHHSFTFPGQCEPRFRDRGFSGDGLRRPPDCRGQQPFRRHHRHRGLRLGSRDSGGDCDKNQP